MTTKLNLTIDKEVAKRIKSYAAKKKKSVSSLTEEYYTSLLKTENKGSSFKSFLDKYAGSIKGKSIDLAQRKDEYIKKKFGV